MTQKQPQLLAEQFISFVKTVYPAGLTKEQHQMAAWMFFAGATSYERVLSFSLQQPPPLRAAMMDGIKKEVNQSAQGKLDNTASVVIGEPDTFEARLHRAVPLT